MTYPCVARILVVDNDLKTRSQLLEILARPGYIIRSAEGQGPELQENAKKLAESFRPHVVIMDLRLIDDEYSEDRSGLELLMEKYFSSSRCVLHSAYLDYQITREAMQRARVSGVVGKEEHPLLLLEAVEKAAREDCICCKREFLINWPSGWESDAVIKTLFGEGTDIPIDAVTDIIGHLFPDAKEITLKPLKGTAQTSTSVYRGQSILFQAWIDNKEPFVIKFAPRDKTIKEKEAYKEYIQDRLVGLFCAQLRDYKIFWELGGICYSFIGSSQKEIQTFSAFYHGQKTSAEIVRPLHHFFSEVWSRHYIESQEEQTCSLFAAYDSFLKLSQRIGDPQTYDQFLTFPALPGSYLNPFRWILEHTQESLISTAKQAITHGDLHGDNLFVEDDHAWAIDFERTKMGPILRDFVELEVDIVTRLAQLPVNDLKGFHDFAVILCTGDKPTDTFKIPKSDQLDEEIMKALDVIEALRAMAYKITGFQDIREYFWGLLYDTLFAVFATDKETQPLKWQRGLLFASILCSRLNQWDDRS